MSDPPRMHPVNGLLRFLLEIGALAVFGWWAATLAAGAWKGIIGAAVPALAAVMWGVFNVPGDPSRSGRAPVVIPGSARLLLEVGFFGAATSGLVAVGRPTWATVFGIAVALHYVWYHRRIAWLLGR